MIDLRPSSALPRALLGLCASLSIAGCGAVQNASVPSPHVVGPSGLVVSPSSLSMSPSQGATVSASENGYSGSYTQTNTCGGIASVGDVGQGQYSVTAVAPGICAITVSDQNGHSQQVAVSVQSIIVGGQ